MKPEHYVNITFEVSMFLLRLKMTFIDNLSLVNNFKLSTLVTVVC